MKAVHNLQCLAWLRVPRPMNWLTCAGMTSHLLTPIQTSHCYTTLPAIRLSSITITGEMGRRPARNSDAPVADMEAQTIRIAAGRAPLGYRRHGMRRPASQMLSVWSEAATPIREVLGSYLIRGSPPQGKSNQSMKQSSASRLRSSCKWHLLCNVLSPLCKL